MSHHPTNPVKEIQIVYEGETIIIRPLYIFFDTEWRLMVWDCTAKARRKLALQHIRDWTELAQWGEGLSAPPRGRNQYSPKERHGVDLSTLSDEEFRDRLRGRSFKAEGAKTGRLPHPNARGPVSFPPPAPDNRPDVPKRVKASNLLPPATGGIDAWRAAKTEAKSLNPGHGPIDYQKAERIMRRPDDTPINPFAWDAPPKPLFYECPKCGSKSYSARDIAEKYCGNCHAFDIRPPSPDLLKRIASEPCPQCGKLGVCDCFLPK